MDRIDELLKAANPVRPSNAPRLDARASCVQRSTAHPPCMSPVRTLLTVTETGTPGTGLPEGLGLSRSPWLRCPLW